MKNTTAKEFLQDSLEISHFYNDKYDIMCCLSDDVQLAMQEYAINKCKELLEIVVRKASVYADEGGYSEFVDKESILNVVDLESFCK